MIIFEPDELEIAIVTYNRCEFVEEWLKYGYEQIKIRNINLGIYDSSTNDDTEKYINEFKKEHGDNTIEYYRIDSDVNIGYKPMFPILSSKAKYVWVSGDSRCHDFHYLDKKVFPYIKKGIDYIILHAINNEENDGKKYISKDELLEECFLSMTCIGLSIYKTEIFNPLKTNAKLMKQCNLKYENNYAFSWIGYFLEVYSLKEYNAVFLVVPIIDIKREKKIQSWFKEFYKCWCENLCDLMDALSDRYSNTEKVIRDTWKYMRLDSPVYCYKARRNGDLTCDIYKRYLENGMLHRVSKQLDRIEYFAMADKKGLDKCLNNAYKQEEEDFFNICKNNINQIQKRANGKEIWIYGAGKGGRILKRCFNKYNIPVCGYIDKNADIAKKYDDLPVRLIYSVIPNEYFIVISLLDYSPFIILSLMQQGIKREDIYFLIIESD